MLLFPAVARATYSIVAVDQVSRQVGGAGTSCVGRMSVTVIYGAAPGHGAVHAQSAVNVAGRDEAVRLLEADVSPVEIIAAITDPDFDPQAPSRQYGVVDLSGQAAGYTGSDNGAYAGESQGTVDSFTYSIQGNILSSSAVIDQARTAFTGGGCDLADRLMLALEAGAMGGEGDSRCTAAGIPSDSGFIRVDPADATDFLYINVTNSAPSSPLIEMRRQYDEWRATHPCPQIADAGGNADASLTDDRGNPADGGLVGGCGCRAGVCVDGFACGLGIMWVLARIVRRPQPVQSIAIRRTAASR